MSGWHGISILLSKSGQGALLGWKIMKQVDNELSYQYSIFRVSSLITLTDKIRLLFVYLWLRRKSF
jgi:hypothetical protein